MNALSPEHFTSAKAAPMPPRKGCDFPIFACNLSRLEPRLAMQAELKLAAMWKASARAEKHFGRLPETKPEGIINATIDPPAEIYAKVSAHLKDRSITVHAIAKAIKQPASYVRAALAQMVREGFAAITPGNHKAAATYRRIAGKPHQTRLVTINGVEYPSLKAAADALDRSPATLAYHLKRGTTDKIGSGLKGGRRPMVSNGVEYPSAAAAARAAGISESGMSKRNARSMPAEAAKRPMQRE